MEKHPPHRTFFFKNIHEFLPLSLALLPFPKTTQQLQTCNFINISAPRTLCAAPPTLCSTPSRFPSYRGKKTRQLRPGRAEQKKKREKHWPEQNRDPCLRSGLHCQKATSATQPADRRRTPAPTQAGTRERARPP